MQSEGYEVYIKFLLGMFFVLISFSSNIYALNCEPLDLRQRVDRALALDIYESGKKLISLVSEKNNYNDVVGLEIDSLYKSYPDEDKLAIKGLLIYSLCDLLDLSDKYEPDEKLLKLNKAINAVLSSYTKSVSQYARNNNAYIRVVDNFIFEIKECRHFKEHIVCFILVTNVSKDRTLAIHAGKDNVRNNSRVFLDTGEELLASSSSLGASNGTHFSKIRLLRDIPVKASIVFPYKGKKVDKIAAIDIYTGFASVQFRNVMVVDR